MNNSWQSKVTDLEAINWSLTDIAAAIGLSISAVSDIKQGRTKEPRGHAAVSLQLLHAKQMKKATRAA
jgi:transcriptional regulator with XRE-family HTH domain